MKRLRRSRTGTVFVSSETGLTMASSGAREADFSCFNGVLGARPVMPALAASLRRINDEY